MALGLRCWGRALLIYVGVSGLLLAAAIGPAVAARARLARACEGVGGTWDVRGGRCLPPRLDQLGLERLVRRAGLP